MKNPAESNPAAADLPSFFDTETDVETSTDDTPRASAGMDANETDEESGDEGAEPTVDEHEFEHVDTDRPRRAALLGQHATAADAARGGDAGAGIGTLVVGCAVVVFAAVLATVLEGSNAAMALARFGVDPATLVVLGGVVFTAGMLRRHMATMQACLTKTGNGDSDFSRSTQESLEFLVAAQHASNERPPAAGEELQHVLMAMQRQDEKINNLTKAIKMYGKPLMEISGQTTDLAGAIAQAKTAIEAGAEAARQAFSRIEAQLKSGGSTKELAEVLDGIHVIAADVDKLCKNSGGPSLEPLQQKVARIEVAVAAVAQRLENSEVQKSLLRLEDATQKTRDEVHQLRGDGLGKATTQLQDRLDKATKGLADGLQQMRDGNLGGLENGMREIQRELSGVATAVSQIQASVRSGKGSMAAASAPAPAPAAPPAAPATPAAAPAANAGKGDDANANYQTGARSTSGKNVLGAIAKLKQMKN